MDGFLKIPYDDMYHMIILRKKGDNFDNYFFYQQTSGYLVTLRMYGETKTTDDGVKYFRYIAHEGISYEYVSHKLVRRPAEDDNRFTRVAEDVFDEAQE